MNDRFAAVDSAPRAYGARPVSGRIRVSPEDFHVKELLGFAPDGEGEHAFVVVDKRGQNTAWVARRLAAFAGVGARAVGYAGLKDRHAVTRQAFSVHLPGRDSPDWPRLDVDGVRVVSATRHRRKLQSGALRENRFVIRVRALAGDAAGLADRVEAIRRSGVPNYFGPQRFGRDNANLERAGALFRGEAGRLGRHKRGLYLSAARSLVFNEILGRRVRDGSWATGLDGDLFALDGTRSWFGPEAVDADNRRRLAALDIHPTGPLWGRGRPASAGACRALEQAVADAWPLFCQGLADAGMKQARRALRLRVREPSVETGESEAVLRFALPPGAYATVVLRELVDVIA